MNGSLKSLVNSSVKMMASMTKGDVPDVFEKFSLTKDRSVFYCAEFAIRFSSATVPVFPTRFYHCPISRKLTTGHSSFALSHQRQLLFSGKTTTFLKKISHSSQELRETTSEAVSMARTLSAHLNVFPTMLKI